ncbi:hypothetical protein TUM4433_17760 [Shewanella schlegeliana]|nr:hypothetical protein TUM4433_17760 [Shewanella schlegeliana]
MDDGSGSGDMDVPSEPLGDFCWSMRPVSNACNFVGALRVYSYEINSGDKRFPPWLDSLLQKGAKRHDVYQA